MIPTEKEIILQMERLSKYKDFKDQSDRIAWFNQIINLLTLFLSSNSFQVKTLEKALNEFLGRDYLTSHRESKLFSIFRGILEATYSDYQKGFLRDLRSEIRVEVDTDFLSQAKRLLNDKLKDSAAMLIGAVLEDSLRQLCQKHGVQDEQNIESMNIPLRQANVYKLTVQKQVTAWAGIRNDADHARFENYDLNQVKLMHQGVLDFVAKHLT